MARGITESDVHTAADELVASGERPTVERIRSHLGTGSPNTVTRWLDTWWKGLGTRLKPERPSLNNAPAALAQLAGEWWALAQEHAREVILFELAGVRQELSNARSELQSEEQRFLDEASRLRATVSESAHAERIALSQVAELRGLVDHLRSQLEESREQCSLSDRRFEQASAVAAAAEARVAELQQLARSERDSLTQHTRSVEDRAMVEIDRARQESKELRSQLNNSEKLHRSIVRTLTIDLESAKQCAIEASKDLERHRTRSAVLEEQLSRIPAAIETALGTKRRSASPRKQAQTKQKKR